MVFVVDPGHRGGSSREPAALAVLADPLRPLRERPRRLGVGVASCWHGRTSGGRSCRRRWRWWVEGPLPLAACLRPHGDDDGPCTASSWGVRWILVVPSWKPSTRGCTTYFWRFGREGEGGNVVHRAHREVLHNDWACAGLGGQAAKGMSVSSTTTWLGRVLGPERGDARCRRFPSGLSLGGRRRARWRVFRFGPLRTGRHRRCRGL